MYRTNLMISVTVFQITSRTLIPTDIKLSDGVTHFVDLIEVSRGDASVSQLIYLEGSFHPAQDKFIFSDKAKERLVPLFTAAFGNGIFCLRMLRLLEEAVFANILAEREAQYT